MEDAAVVVVVVVWKARARLTAETVTSAALLSASSPAARSSRPSP